MLSSNERPPAQVAVCDVTDGALSSAYVLGGEEIRCYRGSECLYCMLRWFVLNNSLDGEQYIQFQQHSSYEQVHNKGVWIGGIGNLCYDFVVL